MTDAQTRQGMQRRLGQRIPRAGGVRPDLRIGEKIVLRHPRLTEPSVENRFAPLAPHGDAAVQSAA